MHALRRVCGLLLVVALLGACTSDTKPAAAPSTSGASAAEQSSAPPPCNRPHAPGQTSETFAFEDVPRTYQLYVPPTYDGTEPVPVVFNFHGYGSNAVQQMVYGDFKPLADRDDFLIVAPDGQDRGGRHFNLSGEPGLQNDITMTSALLDLMESQFCVDTRRVFSTGMSDGGATTSVLACLSSDRFAAFGAVAVVLYPQAACGNARHLAIAAFSGTADPIVPFEGGAVNCCGGVALPAPSEAMANWAAHNGCSAQFTEDRLGSEVVRRSWPGCADDAEVVFYIVEGGGHTWPGSAIPVARLGLTTTQVNASQTIWDFFKAHPLPT